MVTKLLGPDGSPLQIKSNSDLTSRRVLAGRAGSHFGGDRDLYQSFGYPRTLTPEDYTDAYLRQDIAARIVDAFPDATWREAPEVMGDVAGQFAELDKKLKIWRGLHRADRLGGLGHYGVVVLGLDGAQPMHLPADGSDYNLLYIQPHSERTADVIRWEDNPQSKRYGKPVLYRVTTGINWTGAGAGQKNMTVHHSRVIHFAERALEDESIGTPRLERIWNRLMDLDKLLGAGAEIYWQNAAMIMQLKADVEVTWDPAEADDLKSQVEEMQNGLRRWLRTRGVEATNIAPGLQGADPSTVIERQLDIIGGSTGIPKRILIGSERGELSSQQDENNFTGRIEERREQYAGPSIAEAFISRGLRLGFLKGSFEGLKWPENDTLGEAARADIATKNATAIAAYANTPGAELLVSPQEFRETLGYKGASPQVAEDEPLEADEAEAYFKAAKSGAIAHFNAMKGRK